MLRHYIIKEDEPYGENSTAGFLAMAWGAFHWSQEERGDVSYRWLSSTSFPAHAGQKLLGLNAQVSVPYYRLIFKRWH